MLRFCALLGCLFALLVAHSAALGQSAVVRVGAAAGDAFAEAYYAEQKGFFRRAGLQVKITPFSSGTAAETGVASGTVDVSASNTIGIAKAIARGTPVVALAGGGLYSKSSPIVALVVLRTSTLQKPRDLVGKTIAVTTTGDLAQVGISNWLEKNGVSPSKVQFIDLPFLEMTTALKNHLADAAVLTEPWLAQGLRNGARVFARPYDDIAPEFLIGLWFSSKPWAAAHPKIVRRFRSAIYAAARWANTHQDETASLLARFSGTDVALIRASKRAPYATSLDARLVQPSLDVAYKYRAIPRMLDVSELITP